MHDPKFEKAVQDKMEQLEFIPSDSVWENIEMAVTPRRRRAVPVPVWSLLAGLLLTGAGVAVYLHTADRSVAKNVSAPTPANVSTPSNVSASSNIPAPANVPTPAGAGVSENAPLPADAPDIAEKPPGGAGQANRDPIAAGDVPAVGDAPAAIRPTGVGPATGTGTGVEASTVRQHFSFQPGLISCIAAVSGINAPRLPTPPGRATAAAGIQQPHRPWSFGFEGGAGISSYNVSLLDKAPVVTMANSPRAPALAQFTAAATYSGTSSSAKRVSSSVKPDLSYQAGVFAQKPLSARWSVTLGLNLHYYSSQLRIGQLVTSYTAAASALIGAPAVAPVRSYPYYPVGDEQVYTNRYYYLELPVAMQWQLNRSRTLPLYLRGGVALSRLMSSNGLYYNDQSAVYFKDNSVIHPMQVSFSSGLVAGLSLRGIRIQTGPELQYGATSLLKGGAGNGHLIYGGLRVVVMR